jgi:CcmD family protein
MNYLIAAYVAVFVVLIVYVISLARRQSNLRREVEALRRQDDTVTR